MAQVRARTRDGDRTTHRLVAALALVALLVPVEAGTMGAGSSTASAASGWSFSRPERCFMKKINRKRAHRGRRRLNWDKQLGVVARRHARHMARRGYMYHDPGLGRKVTRWIRLGQNTGMGGRCRGLFRAFWRSSAHRANILGRWTYLGVGVRRRGGRLYVQQVFEARRNPGNIWHYP